MNIVLTYKVQHLAYGNPVGEDAASRVAGGTSGQPREDYDNFLESLTDLLTDYYDLELTWLSLLDDYSEGDHFLARTKDHKVEVEYRSELCVADQIKYLGRDRQPGEPLLPYTKEINVTVKTEDGEKESMQAAGESMSGEWECYLYIDHKIEMLLHDIGSFAASLVEGDA